MFTDMSLIQLSKPVGLKFGAIDVGKSKQLAQKYSVNALPMLKVFGENKLKPWDYLQVMIIILRNNDNNNNNTT
jgi:hypothetical protein